MRVRRPTVTALLLTVALAAVGVLVLPGRVSAARATTERRLGSGPADQIGKDAGARDPGNSESMTLVSQTTWVGDRSTFDMRVALSGSAPLRSLDVTVSVYGSLQTRSGFTATQQGRELGRQLWSETGGVNQLAPTGGPVPLCVPVNINPPAGCKAGAPVFLNQGPGVYPVEVALQNRDTGATLDRLYTHLVLVPSQGASTPLRVALVQPVAAAQPLLPNGARSITNADLAHLAGVASVLGAGPPVTAAPDGATLAALADAPAGQAHDVLAGLRHSPGAEVVATPFAPFSPYDLVTAGLADDVATQLQRGAEIAQAQLGTRPGPGTWVIDGPLDHDTLGALAGLGATRLVVPSDDVEPGFSRLTPAQPYPLDTGGTIVPALVEDANLAADLALADPVLGAHELLADLAQTYLEAPNTSRGIVALAPRSWPVDRTAADAVTAGLATSPILAATTVDQIFAGVQTATSRATAATPATSGSGRRQSLPAGRIRADRAAQAALASSVTATLPAVGSMNDLVLASEADGLDNGQRSAYLSGAERVLAGQTGMVSVVRSAVTLTSRQATVPVSVQSLLPVPIAVRLTVSSDQLQFPGGGTSDTLPVQTLSHQNTTFNVPVTTRGVGSFPLQVTIVTANGDLQLAATRLTINSRAFSGVGIALSAGALVFLALWWGRELRRGRRVKDT